MCVTTDFHGFQSRDQTRLKIKAFYIRFSGLKPDKPLPEWLTLLYLPRINETMLVIDGSKIRPDSLAFVTLHRVVNVKTKEGEAIFGSREWVRAGEGIQFEVYLTEERILEGIFRKDEEDAWKLECKCGIESEAAGGVGAAAEAEVCVAAEGQPLFRERVGMLLKGKKKSKRIGFDRLEMIPEKRDEVDDESDGECCSCGEGSGSEGGDLEEETCGADCKMMETEEEEEGGRWAVEVGIWVVCLGAGYLFSKASAKSLRRLRIL